jgi:aryl-alcohol dehydrogenase-like predicted oxidoreductase
MAHPSSADPETHELALDEYARRGGNCIHIHGEGGETHTRRATGRWLQRHGLRPEFFLCSQICHTGWDESAGVVIDRFTPAAVSEDIETDLELLGTEFLDFVYLDDSPAAPFEPIIEAIGKEIELGRVCGFGVRNWNAQRLTAAQAYLSSKSLPKITAIVTTELALAVASTPLWPEYVPFDSELRPTAEGQQLTVFAHAADIILGQFLYEDAVPALRQQWIERWQDPGNVPLIQRVKSFANARGLTTREVNVAWLLNQKFPCIAIASLPDILMEHGIEYERASQLVLSDLDRAMLRYDR